MAKREKVTVDEIIGIVKTEEVTDSVEEVRKLRGRETMTEKRFTDDWSDEFEKEVITDHHNSDYEMLEKEACELLNELHEENQLLKQALRESLEEEGNAYVIDLLDKIFDLKYCEWQKKMNDTHTYDYVEWEEILEQKRDDVE